MQRNAGIKCRFLPIDSTGIWPTFQCRACGCVVEVAADVSAVQSVLDSMPPCGAVQERSERSLRDFLAILPKAAGTVQRYVSAVARWNDAGRPVRPWDRVEELFTTACGPCPKFRPWKDGEAGGCTICGCRLSRHGAAYKNKLRMATEGCPASPPRFLPDFPQTAVAVPPENG